MSNSLQIFQTIVYIFNVKIIYTWLFYYLIFLNMKTIYNGHIRLHFLLYLRYPLSHIGFFVDSLLLSITFFKLIFFSFILYLQECEVFAESSGILFSFICQFTKVSLLFID
jgi:hypothetical protein